MRGGAYWGDASDGHSSQCVEWKSRDTILLIDSFSAATKSDSDMDVAGTISLSAATGSDSDLSWLDEAGTISPGSSENELADPADWGF